MLINNTLWLLAEKLIKLLGAVVVSALVARHLQPEGFGVLNFYLAMLSIASVMSSLGLNRIIVREIASSLDSKHVADIVSTAFYLRLMASFTVFVIAVASSHYFVPQQHGYYAVIVFICLIFNASEVLDFYQQGISSFKVVSKVRLVSFAVSVTFKLVLVLLEVELVWFLIANLLEYLLASLLIYRFCARMGTRSILAIGQFERSRAKSFLSESWPEIIAGFSAILFLKMDQVMLYYLSDDAAVGIYSAASRLSEAWYFIPSAIVATTFPKIVALKEHPEKYKEFILQLFTFLTYLSLVIAAMVMLIGNHVVDLIYGHGYKESAAVLVIHIWAGLFLCMGIASGSWLAAEKRLKLNLYRNIFGLLVNFVGNIMLIPQYGATGAAIAMVMGLFSAFYLFDLLHPKLRMMFYSKTRSFSIFQLFVLIKTCTVLIKSRQI